MSTQQSGLVAGNKQNEAGGATGKSRSRFPLSYSFIATERFAEYTPFYVQEGVSGDRLPFNSNHELQTYNLKSPVIQSLVKKKDFFSVPMQAILPNNWEKFYTNPNIGEDVPENCGLGVVNFWSLVRTCFINSVSYLSPRLVAEPLDVPTSLTEIFRFFIFFEKFYSAGSLLEYLGISGHNYFRARNSLKELMFDEIFDSCMQIIAQILGNSGSSNQAGIDLTIGGNEYRIVANKVDYASSRQDILLREALELMRDDMSFTVTAASSQFESAVSQIGNLFASIQFELPTTDSPLNLGRLWAYQLVVAHYYSNDHVDFIYSAELFRQYVYQLITKAYPAEFQLSRIFKVNGLEYQYDALSSWFCSNVLSLLGSSSGIFAYNSSGTSSPSSLYDIYAYFTAMLSFKRSLRFMDYFTGSRTYPLAVGDSSVSVANNKVNIIDLSRSSMMTKFLQAVNRSGRKFGAYMQELFGITPKYDYHNPLYLAHISDVVGASETDNTGNAQVSDRIAVTSRLRATSSRYAFEFEPDRDCIVIGLSYYDLPRVYSRATERQNFAVDRFDYFNPYLQFIGDQSIRQDELGTDTPTSQAFSYTNRDMQYKQRYNQCAGGFCVPSTGLDHWIFIADELRRKSVHNISPSFIRSFNSEIDKFYQGLTGYSLGTYFHFIVRYDNRMNASRPMAFNPTINV